MQKEYHPIEIKDLYTDLKDGERLIELLQVISEKKIPVQTSRGSRPEAAEKFMSLERIQTALEFLKQYGNVSIMLTIVATFDNLYYLLAQVKLENIRPIDIEQGKEKETLALTWALMQYRLKSEELVLILM